MSSVLNNYQTLDDATKANIKYLALGLVGSLCSTYYRHQTLQDQMLDRSFNDPQMWNNDYPIVLVHGYCGTTMDENWILGGYFHYAFSSIARYCG